MATRLTFILHWEAFWKWRDLEFDSENLAQEIMCFVSEIHGETWLYD